MLRWVCVCVCVCVVCGAAVRADKKLNLVKALAVLRVEIGHSAGGVAEAREAAEVAAARRLLEQRRRQLRLRLSRLGLRRNQ